MPKEKEPKPELPSEFANAYPEHLRPVRTKINRLQHTSPFPEWPGTITTPLFLSAPDYAEWYEAIGDKKEDDKRHWSLHDWETRYHLVKAWNLDNLDLEILAKNPGQVPDMRLIIWMVTLLQPVITFSTSLPNWPEPSSDITTLNAKPEAA